MQPELETRGTQTDKGWKDHDGFIGPVQPGTGPRSDPRGDFPTGHEVGDTKPNVRCTAADATQFDLHPGAGPEPSGEGALRSAGAARVRAGSSSEGVKKEVLSSAMLSLHSRVQERCGDSTPQKG